MPSRVALEERVRMNKPGPTLNKLYPLVVATAVSLTLYSQQALLLLLKVGEVFNGVFDTSVPAFPLAGMFFVVVFIALRKDEFVESLRPRAWDAGIGVLGIVMAVVPLVALLGAGGALDGSYSYAAMALATGWVGVLLAVRPASLSFLWPYLLAFLLAVGTVGLLTTAFGDPLAVVVASISRVMTSALGLSVTWTSVYMSFTAAGGVPMSLYISQECSGMASMSIFLLLIVLMHLDVRPSLGVTAMFAVGGSVLFILLNSLRVVVLILGGIYYGEGVLWNLHGWLGYVLYVAGYMVILLLYIGRMKPANQAVLGAQVKATPS